jgi:uncharacterized repeat protein (TIGR02543 family)
MTAFIKSGGAFKKLEKIFLKDSLGTWRGVVSAYLKDSLGTWRLFFGAEYLNPSVVFEPALVSNDSIGKFKQGATLSLDRGIWDGNPTSYSLTIQGTLDNGATWIDFATGSGNSVTYLLDISDVIYPSYSFRGKVVATNTYGSTTFYTLTFPSILDLIITGSVSSPTQNGATFSWTVNPSTSGYRASQRIEFYSVSNPSVTPVYTFNVPTNSANSAVVSNTALTAATQYNAVIKIVSLDSSETVNFSDDILFTTASTLVNTVAPTITGTKQEGQTVTADPGTWSGNGTITYAYQWQRGFQESSSIFSYTDISGATSSTYFIPYDFNETNFGGGLRLKVTATTVDTPAGVVAYSQNYLITDFARPVGTDDTVTFSRDSSSSYNFSITNTGTWTGSPTSYRYQWYTYESTFGGNSAWFEISGATSSTFNASGIKLASIMPIVWASNAGGESDTGYSLTNTNGTRPTGNIGSISAAATQIVKYTAPIIGSFSVTGGAGSITYSYSVTGDDPSRTLTISYSGAATGSFTPGASGSTQSGLAAGTYTFVLTSTNSTNGNAYSTTSTVANIIVTAPLTAPVNTVAPSVTPLTGTAGVTTYTTTNGTWTGNPTPTFTYQWQYNDQGSTWVSMSGATSSTFSPTANFFTTEARVSPIRCRVTATNSQAPSGVAATSNEVVVSRPVYVVTYDYQSATGGNGTASVNVTQGNSTSLPTPTRTNYTFGGWYTAITGGTFIGNGGFAYTPTASITLYARWTAINWTVSWDANGGTVSPTSNTGIQGSTVTAPTPTRTNFTFLYWRDSLSAVSYLYQLSAGGTWTQSQTITFYAWWQQITYLVTYNANGGSVSPASATVNAGSATTLPTPTRANFTFNGWYTAASGGSLVGSGGGSYTPTAAITLYAQWTAVIVNYTVTWNAVGGSGGGSTTQQAGVAHTAPSPGTQLGYTFNGYYNTSAGDFLYGPIASGGSFTPPSTISMFARWTAIIPNISSITVTGNVTAGVTCSAVMTNTQSVQYVLYGRDTGTSAWTQLASGTASANGTSLTSAISTTSSVGTLPDQYYVTMLPFFGARSTSGTGGGTGTSGTTRSTIGSPKSNASGFITVNY